MTAAGGLDNIARRERFPIGAEVRSSDLDHDPYPIYERLRWFEPISWIASLGMYFVTSDALVREILLDDRRFTTTSPNSVIQETFGANMLTSDGDLHDRYRRRFQPAFMPVPIRKHLLPAINAAADALVSTRLFIADMKRSNTSREAAIPFALVNPSWRRSSPSESQR